jgi:hypothetical protein
MKSRLQDLLDSPERVREIPLDSIPDCSRSSAGSKSSCPLACSTPRAMPAETGTRRIGFSVSMKPRKGSVSQRTGSIGGRTSSRSWFAWAGRSGIEKFIRQRTGR